MNERIKELALQAEETYTYKDFSPNGGEETKQSKTVNLEKFAELIVIECMGIVSKAGNSKAEILWNLEELIWSNK